MFLPSSQFSRERDSGRRALIKQFGLLSIPSQQTIDRFLDSLVIIRWLPNI